MSGMVKMVGTDKPQILLTVYQERVALSLLILNTALICREIMQTAVQPFVFTQYGFRLLFKLTGMMSSIFSTLPSLTKEDLKNLMKLAEKEKRSERAKTAEIGPTFNTPKTHSSVSFDAPVKVNL